MPLYEYICSSCGQRLELLVQRGQKPVCPSCGSRKLDRQLSVPAAGPAKNSPGCCSIPGNPGGG